MEGAIYGCPATWTRLLPPGVRRIRQRDLWRRPWDVLALTPQGCERLRRQYEPPPRWKISPLDFIAPPRGKIPPSDFLAAPFWNKPPFHMIAPRRKEQSREPWPRGKAPLLGVTDSAPRGKALSCGLLLVPGDCPPERLPRMRTACAASYGLSPRDSLTFSSLQEPVLCVQRALPAPDGGLVEPQEIPLPGLPSPVEQFLPLLALWLLFGP